MSKATLTLDGKRFVVLAESEYRLLKAQAARAKPAGKPRRAAADTDAGDVAEARRRLAGPKRVDAADVFRRLAA